MVEFLPSKDGLVHISELADYRVASVEDVVKVGDEITVKVIGIDNLGRVNLSRRAVFEESTGVASTGVKNSPNRDNLSRRQERPHRAPQSHSPRNNQSNYSKGPPKTRFTKRN